MRIIVVKLGDIQVCGDFIVMQKAQQLKPQDIVILLKLFSVQEESRLVDIASDLGLSQSEVSEGIKRLHKAKLLSSNKREPLRANTLEFLLSGLKYAFPASLGAVARGVATAHSAPPLSSSIVSSEQERYVWADPMGKDRGQTIVPLYPSVPVAVLKDLALYELLALVDAIRIGRSRERKIAERELTKRIMTE